MDPPSNPDPSVPSPLKTSQPTGRLLANLPGSQRANWPASVSSHRLPTPGPQCVEASGGRRPRRVSVSTLQGTGGAKRGGRGRGSARRVEQQRAESNTLISIRQTERRRVVLLQTVQ